MWVTAKSKIVRNYLRGWFSIDLITVIDFQARFSLPLSLLLPVSFSLPGNTRNGFL